MIAGKKPCVRELVGFEACDETKQARHRIVVGNSNLSVHLVKIAVIHLKHGELPVPVAGGNDQFCQLLKESGVWWPMEVVIGMCALFQHVRTNAACMFVPTAKTRRRVETMPPSVKTVLTIAFKRTGHACLEIPAAGCGNVLVHDVTMQGVSEAVRRAKIEEWRSVVDMFTRASVEWRSKSPVRFECVPCQAVGFDKLDGPVHCVEMVRMFLLGKTWADGLPWPPVSTIRKSLVGQFQNIWRKLHGEGKLVLCHADRGNEAGLHTLEDAKLENPRATLLRELAGARKRDVDGNLLSRIAGHSDVMTHGGVSSNKQRSVLHMAAKCTQKRRLRKKMAKHEERMVGLHTLPFRAPLSELMDGKDLVQDATYYFASPHHMPDSPLIDGKRKIRRLVVGDVLRDLGKQRDIVLKRGVSAVHIDDDGARTDLFCLVPRDQEGRDEVADTVGHEAGMRAAFEAFQELEDHTKKDDCRNKPDGKRIAGKDGHSHYTNLGTTTLIFGRGMTTKMGAFTKPQLRGAFTAFSTWVKGMDRMSSKWMSPDSRLLFAAVKKCCDQRGLRLSDGSEALYPAMVVQKNPFLNCHTDPDFNIAMVAILSHGFSNDVVCYFCFPTLNCAVPLRSGDVLYFNPKIPHCVSARMDPTKDSFCVSFYMNKNYPSGRDERQVLTSAELEGSAFVKASINNKV